MNDHMTTAELRSTVLKIVLPLLGIALPILVARLRGFNLREFFGLYSPRARTFALWLAIWIVWMALTELFLHLMNMGQPKAWPDYPLLIVILRVIAIGVLGPIAEELFFRGLLFSRLSPKLGATATIVLLAVVFGVIHHRYDAAIIALVIVDGLFFGYARHQSGSVFTPMAMHTVGNLFSIWQSLR